MSAIRRLFWDLLLIWLQINAHASVSWADEAGWGPRDCALQACRRSEEPSSPSTVKSCLMASWQWQHPTTRLGLVQAGRMSLIPSGLRAFLLDPTSSAVIHAARLGEQMFSFSSTHGGGSFASTSVCSQKNSTPGGAPGLFSSATPNFHPKRWCNPFTDHPLTWHKQAVRCSLFLCMWKHWFPLIADTTVAVISVSYAPIWNPEDDSVSL